MQMTGNIEDLGLGEILQILSFSGKSGVLHLRAAKKDGIIVFKDGFVVKALSNGMKESVGDLLVRDGAITPEQLVEARKRQKDGGYAETLGSILVRELKLSPQQLDCVATKQIEKTVSSFFSWSEGCFVFELGDYPEGPEAVKGDCLQHTLGNGLSAQFLAMEGLRLLDESAMEEKPVSCGADAMDEQPAGAADEVGDRSGDTEGTEQGDDTLYQFQDLLEVIGRDVCFPDAGGGAVPRVAESKGLRVLKGMLEELARPLSLNEIVLLILRFSSEIINRSVVFQVKDEFIVGFGQFGIELSDDLPDNRVRKMRIPLAKPSILSQALDQKKIVVKEPGVAEWDRYIIEQLGGQRPVEAFAVPIMVQDKVMMILYGDNVPQEEKLDDLSTLDIFLGQTSIAMERLVLRENLMGL